VLLLGQAVAPGSLVLAPAQEGGADFGDVAIGATNTRSFTLTNPGNQPSGPVTIRADDTAFAVQPDNCSPAGSPGIVDGASCTFDVVFTPADPAPVSGRLLVLSAALGEVSLELRGRGRAPAALEATATRDLGQANVGQDPGPLNQFTWTVNNTGDLPTGTLAVVSSNLMEFEVSNDTCSDAPIAARASCQMLIGFRPSQAGARTGTITVTDTESMRGLVLALTGLGQRVAQPGESCINAVCAEGTCTAGVCCDRECDRTCQVCNAAGVCLDQENQEACGTGNARCFGVDQCLLPEGTVCGSDTDCGGDLLCKTCSTGGRRCTAPDECCGGCPGDLSCVNGSCGCTAAETDCGGGVCISRTDPLACCPGSLDCPSATPICNEQGRCVECIGDGSCGECERCDTARGVCVNTPRGQPGRCAPPGIAICDGNGFCTIPQCIPGGGCPECQSCQDFNCLPITTGSLCSIGVCDDRGFCQECNTSSDCADCETCDFNSCVPLAPGSSSQNCGFGQVCDNNGQCIDSDCTTNANCSACETCVNFRCEQTIPPGDLCGDGLLCNDRGDCVLCISDLQCLNPAVEFCDLDLGRCVPRP